MTLTPSASLSLAVFFRQSRDWRPSSVEAASHALIREGMDVAATLGGDPLRGDPDSPTIRHLVALLHRPRALGAAFFAGADRARAALVADPYPVAPTYRATDVTGWTVQELEDLASDDAWTEDLYADEVAAWEARRAETSDGAA